VAVRLRVLGGLSVSASAGDGDPLSERPLPVQLKPLALLAYIALTPNETPIRRDTLIGILWPESEQRGARGALRQALYHVRQSVAPGVLISHGPDAVAKGPGLWCDATAMELRAAAGDLEGALALYAGDAFAGVHLADAPSRFESWLDGRRAFYHALAQRSAWTLAERAAATGNEPDAVRWIERAIGVDPDDERLLCRGLMLLSERGQACAALRIADLAARRVGREDGALSVETMALVAAIQDRVAAQPPATLSSPIATAAGILGPVAPGRAGVSPRSGDRPRSRTRAHSWRRGVATLAVALTVAVGPATGAHPAGVGSRSPLARGLYEEGLRTADHLEYRTAARLFHLALSVDTGCALCAYQASAAEFGYDGASSLSDLMRAVRLVPAIPSDQELVIAAAAAAMTNSPTQLAIAERLASRDPDAPTSNLALGRARLAAGDFLGAVVPLERGIRSLRHRQSPVDTALAAETWSTLVLAYQSADSLAAAERVARDWIDDAPHSARAWRELANALGRQYRFGPALAATHESTRLQATGSDAMSRAILALRQGDFATADHVLESLWQDGDDGTRQDALWWSIVSFRTQGRLGSALTLARRYRVSAPERPFGEVASSAAVPEAQVLFEMGRFREAAALFHDISQSPREIASASPGNAARHRVWYLTQTATALAAAGDTSVRAIADTVAAIAPQSGYGRDQHLAPYLRGLVAVSEGRRADAERLLRLAIGSPTEGYTRTQLALGGLLVDAGRPGEAVGVLTPVLRGPIESGSYYATLTDVHALLARAYEADGRVDSAVVHYRWVASAWRGGDPPFAQRAERARQRANMLVGATIAARPISR
jgi:DNA-binding SARP family transcriptional activator/tetratricopeptide (TPR) repeat protein